MINESIIIGVMLFLLFGAASIYLYSVINHHEKKLSMMESLLIDMRMAMDSLLTEDGHNPAPIPITTGGVPAAPPAPVASDGEEGDEKFYSSVLEQAAANAEEESADGAVSIEKALEGMKEGAEATAEDALRDHIGGSEEEADYETVPASEVVKV